MVARDRPHQPYSVEIVAVWLLVPLARAVAVKGSRPCGGSSRDSHSALMRKACAIIFAPITAEVLHSAAVCRGCRQPFKWRLLVRLLKSPKTFRSHKTTPITTTAFKIDLMDDAIGMKLLTSQRRTPITIRTTKT